MAESKIFIGPELRAIRLKREETQSEFAKMIGLSVSLVNAVERNQRSASLAFLLKISEACQINLLELTSSTTAVTV